jgi:hypothetical protein
VHLLWSPFDLLVFFFFSLKDMINSIPLLLQERWVSVHDISDAVLQWLDTTAVFKYETYHGFFLIDGRMLQDRVILWNQTYYRVNFPLFGRTLVEAKKKSHPCLIYIEKFVVGGAGK